MNKAIFFDRDGTLCEDRNYLRRSEDIRILPGVIQALQQLRDRGFQLIIVTNQSGVARGYFTEEELAEIHSVLAARFGHSGIQFAGIYHCPHLEGAEAPAYSRPCDCRKPQPGLLLQAASDHGIDLKGSFMIGDKASDIEAGRRAGCRTVLLAEAGSTPDISPAPDRIAPDMQSAVDWILHLEER
jgi:D-glycero-D-manno-heptose 1,7-bisphosphate phosphatase